MIEIIIERWTGLDGTTDYRWSVWIDGRRAQMGGPHGTSEESEHEALAFCRLALNRDPDRVTRL